jgi:hypothetical protein
VDITHASRPIIFSLYTYAYTTSCMQVIKNTMAQKELLHIQLVDMQIQARSSRDEGVSSTTKYAMNVDSVGKELAHIMQRREFNFRCQRGPI